MSADEELREEITKLARDGKVACKAMLDAATRLNVPAARLGQLANEMGIKISGCQLGCFR